MSQASEHTSLKANMRQLYQKKINSLQSFNNFLIGNNHIGEIVVNLRKDRMKVAFGSEKQVEVFSDKQIERMLFYI